jgi:predicted MFS family arabinose efflux permease
MLFAGAYAAVVLTFRFAAAECVPPRDRPRALSFVLAGGVAAGVFGPRLVNATMDLWPPHAYAATYLGAAAAAVISAVVLVGVRFEARPAPSASAPARPLSAIIRQPVLIVAMLSGVVSYMMMNFMMTSAPLAMELCGIARTDAHHGIELHVIAMYAPSFFTGRLIARFGAPAVILAGLAGIALAAVAGMSGLTVPHFWGSLVLLGVGWNFGFLGASALVLTCHSPDEGPRVQAINDFVVFGAMVLASFASGGLLTSLGWQPISALTLLPVLVAAAAVIWLQWRRARGAREYPTPNIELPTSKGKT